jgi:hypothetical protein
MREKGNELVYIPGIGQNLLNYVWAGAIFNSVWADTIIVWGVICLNYYTLHRISINGVYLHIYAISPSPPRVVKLSRRENIIHLSVCQKTYTILSFHHCIGLHQRWRKEDCVPWTCSVFHKTVNSTFDFQCILILFSINRKLPKKKLKFMWNMRRSFISSSCELMS